MLIKEVSRYPLVKSFKTGIYIDLRFPTGELPEEAGVGNIVFLVTQTPIGKCVMAGAAGERLNTVKDFQKAGAVIRTTADIECLAGSTSRGVALPLLRPCR